MLFMQWTVATLPVRGCILWQTSMCMLAFLMRVMVSCITRVGLTLPSSGSVRGITLMSPAASVLDCLDEDVWNAEFVAMQKKWSERIHRCYCKTPHENFDRFVNYWLKNQLQLTYHFDRIRRMYRLIGTAMMRISSTAVQYTTSILSVPRERSVCGLMGLNRRATSSSRTRANALFW